MNITGFLCQNVLYPLFRRWYKHELRTIAVKRRAMHMAADTLVRGEALHARIRSWDFALTDKEARIEELDTRLTIGAWGYNMCKVKFTCSNCSHASTCVFSWDPYNTDGDCIASK